MTCERVFRVGLGLVLQRQVERVQRRHEELAAQGSYGDTFLDLDEDGDLALALEPREVRGLLPSPQNFCNPRSRFGFPFTHGGLACLWPFVSSRSCVRNRPRPPTRSTCSACSAWQRGQLGEVLPSPASTNSTKLSSMPQKDREIPFAATVVMMEAVKPVSLETFRMAFSYTCSTPFSLASVSRTLQRRKPLYRDDRQKAEAHPVRKPTVEQFFGYQRASSLCYEVHGLSRRVQVLSRA